MQIRIKKSSKLRQLQFEMLESRSLFAIGGLISADPVFNQDPNSYPSFGNVDLPLLHSNPNADAVIYLRFEGGIDVRGDYYPPSDFETKGTSTSSNSYSLGSKTFVTQAGLSFEPGHRIHITNSADPERFMNAIVTSYSGTSLVVDVDYENSSGSVSNWTITNTHFNAAEREQIIDFWKEISQSYSIFNVDVTTDWVDLATKPVSYVAFFSNNGGVNFRTFPMTAAGSRTTDWQNGGGIAVHEIAHSFGVRHQSNYNILGLVTDEYGFAHNSFYNPLMGTGLESNYDPHFRKWYFGQPNNSATAPQDDIARVAATLTANGVTPFRTTEPDFFADWGDTINTAGSLNNLGNHAFAQTGILYSLTDTDIFAFSPSVDGYYDILAGQDGSAGDFSLQILSSNGTVLASEDGDSTTLTPLRNVYDQHITRFFTAGTYYISVKSHGNYADLGAYVVRASRVGASNQPWRAEDVGFVGVPGYSSFNSTNNTYTIAGSGADFARNENIRNGYHYLSQQLQGNGTIIARLDSFNAPAEWANAGIMIRENLGGDSKFVSFALTRDYGYLAFWDTGVGDPAFALESFSPNVTFAAKYLKIVRSGNNFTFSISTNGTSYTQIGQPVTISMSSTAYIGLYNSGVGDAIISPLDGTVMDTINSQRLAVAQFSNVSITAGVGGVLNPNPFANLNNFITSPLQATAATSNSITLSWNQAFTPGDTNGDGLINIVDYNNVKNNFGSSGLGDTNYDGVINIVDYNNVKNNFGASGGGATGYILERSEDGVNFTTVSSSISSSTFTYTDNVGLHDSEIYYYRLRAKKADGSVSNPTSVISKSTRAGAVALANIYPSIIGTNEIVIRWDDVDGDTGYRVWRSTSENGTYTPFFNDRPANNSFIYDNISKNADTTYWYKIETLDQFGASGTSMSLPFSLNTRWTTSSIANFTPTNITSSSVTLDWVDFAGATSYKVFRGLQANGAIQYIEVANVTSSVFNDSGLDPSLTYTYNIYAVNSSGRFSAPRVETVNTPAAASPASNLSIAPRQSTQQLTQSSSTVNGVASSESGGEKISSLIRLLSSHDLSGSFVAATSPGTNKAPDLSSTRSSKTPLSRVTAIELSENQSRNAFADAIKSIESTSKKTLIEDSILNLLIKSRKDLSLKTASAQFDLAFRI
jgi:hypothetical protein